MDRVDIVHQNFLTRVAAGDLPTGRAPTDALSNDEALNLFQIQLTARALDRTSRAMQKIGQGYYTIGSSGHEGMAAVAHALRPDDIAFLHYRDAAFQLARAEQGSCQTMTRDVLFSFACSSDDPMSGGRHKVLGSRDLMIPPQTSTIASHLPKAVGAAYGLTLARRYPPEHQMLRRDGIAICSFGDASVNHSTAQGAFNTAGWTSHQDVPLPLLLVCEDNGIGISTRTPDGWVEASMSNRPGFHYIKADGLDLYDTARAASDAANLVRKQRKPVFLHLTMVRLYGHAGADMPTTYLPLEQVESEEANDPLLHSVRLLKEAGVLSLEDALALYRKTLEDVAKLAEDAASWPRLLTADDVAASLIPPKRYCAPAPRPDAQRRAALFGRDRGSIDQPQPMSRHINWALTDLMLEHNELVLMGEDVGRKGGVYGVTQKLQQRFGQARVIDTLLDEQSILGLAIGMAHNGFIPIPEIQFLAYLHNAEDQLRGEAATLPFFSQGQFTNPMVIRIAGLGYQKGFGGHFHNDNSLAVLRDIPGIILACPSTGEDAAMMLRECVRLAREEQRIAVFLEPIALYPTRDLHEQGDEAWMTTYPLPDRRIDVGTVGIHGEGNDLAIVTYGNGHYLARQAEQALRDTGIDLRIIDLRWLAPLPETALLQAVEDCDAVLIVDECRRTGGQAEALMALFSEQTSKRVARLTADDSFIATGPSYAATLPSVETIILAARNLVR